MDFKTNKPIYQQIVDFCFSKILTREWRGGEGGGGIREGALHTTGSELAHRAEGL